jgi:hypothetical protein
MKFAPVLLLLAASTALADGWEWKRRPVTAEDDREIKRIARLTPLAKYELDAAAESERVAMNHQTMMQYNRMLPTPMPMLPTPCVPPPARRGIHRFIH